MRKLVFAVLCMLAPLSASAETVSSLSYNFFTPVDDNNPFLWLSQRYVTHEDCVYQSESTLRIWRNAIYACHGYIFKDSSLYSYFRQFSWFNPRYTNVEKKFSEIERTNIAFINRYRWQFSLDNYDLVATANLDKHMDYRNTRLGVSPEEFLKKAINPSDEWCLAEYLEGEEITPDGTFAFVDYWLGQRIVVYGSCDKKRRATKVETWIPADGDMDIDENIEMLKDNFVSIFEARAAESILKDVNNGGHKGYYICPIIDSTKDFSASNIYGVIEVTYEPKDKEIHLSFTDHIDPKGLAKYF